MVMQRKHGAPPRPPFGSNESIFATPTMRAYTSLSNPQSPTGVKSICSNTADSPSIYLDLILPVAYVAGSETESKELTTIGDTSSETFKTFIKHDLCMDRLNRIHKHLYFAGSPACASTLHEQSLIGRSFIITEQADLHLVWHESTIYLKPVPEYLLDFEVWENVVCKDQKIFEEANGMLLSYMWLICSKSDLKVAHDVGLLASEVGWDRWTSLSKVVLQKLDHHTLRNISPRFLYGELRLGRLNLIYRLRSPFHNPFLPNPTWGYHYHRRQYKETIQQNFNRLLAATVYVTVVLTAMQVGLGTNDLKDNGVFNRVSYGFTIFAITAPLILLFIIIFVQFAHFVWKLINALDMRRRKQKELQHIFSNSVVQQLCR